MEIEYKKLFDELKQGGESKMLNIIYISLISSNTLINLDNCNKSIAVLRKMLRALEACEIDDVLIEKWKKRIEDGLEICEREKQMLSNEISDEKSY